jgi:hypothetical protein
VEHFRLAAASVVNVHPTFHFEVAQFMKKAGAAVVGGGGCLMVVVVQVMDNDECWSGRDSRRHMH